MAYRHVVFTIPKMLCGVFLRDRKMLRERSRCAWNVVRRRLSTAVGDARAVPGALLSRATAGDLISAHLYAWINRPPEYQGACLHAKIALADEQLCFITSANLTGHAMERNMEAGILLTGGPVTQQVAAHLLALVQQKVVSLVGE